jgi:hypothetical protein
MSYEEKKSQRIDRLRGAAEKARTEAQRVHDRAMEQAQIIPMGQPILVGHHSERRDRKTRARIGGMFDRAYALDKRASEFARSALAAEKNQAISSDDPSACERLQERIDALTTRRAEMVCKNRAARKAGTPVPHEAWELSNIGANIRRLTARFQELTARATLIADAPPEVEQQIGEVRVVHNLADNRLQLFFPQKPDMQTREALRKNGFVWAPSVGAWQRKLNNAARYAAGVVLGVQLPSVTL